MTEGELRYNYFFDEWIIYAPKRQRRPDRKKDFCPFCKGSEKSKTLLINLFDWIINSRAYL
ncbi:hypothetical protein DRN69_08400 [Candidatus Pacearchaeota archaeon]|nr:MAG: hypothetical protein DRN69_08400 [Candidatus Pacearchaeota archaeon]